MLDLLCWFAWAELGSPFLSRSRSAWPPLLWYISLGNSWSVRPHTHAHSHSRTKTHTPEWCLFLQAICTQGCLPAHMYIPILIYIYIVVYTYIVADVLEYSSLHFAWPSCVLCWFHVICIKLSRCVQPIQVGVCVHNAQSQAAWQASKINIIYVLYTHIRMCQERVYVLALLVFHLILITCTNER